MVGSGAFGKIGVSFGCSEDRWRSQSAARVTARPGVVPDGRRDAARGASVPAPAAPAAVAEPGFEDLAEAEQYAVIYPVGAEPIRAYGGLPGRIEFGPREPAIIEALVRGTGTAAPAFDPPAYRRSVVAT